MKVPAAALNRDKYFKLGLTEHARATFVIDRMLRSSPPGVCELCEKRPANLTVRFTTQFVELLSSPPFDEEKLSSVELRKRVCEECAKGLRNSENVTNLIVEQP